MILANSSHSYLNLEDNCFFFGEYTIRENWSFSDVNQFILNFKKIRSRCNSASERRHKDRAIIQAADLWADALSTPENLAAVKSATLIPVPPSRAPNDPDYDDRLVRMLDFLSQRLDGLDVRQLVIQSANYQASHLSVNRPTPMQLAANYVVNENLANPSPHSLWIFDDTLISGSHYRGISTLLNARFPGVPCFGMFLARGIHREL